MSDERDQELREALLGVLERLGMELDPLERVEDIPRLESFADDASRALVAGARAAGASWSDIAGRLGVSRQAVHKRFTAQEPSVPGGSSNSGSNAAPGEWRQSRNAISRAKIGRGA